MISVGIDIGRSSVKIAEVETTSRSYFIRRFQEFPLSLDLSKDKKIEVIDVLRNLISQYDLDATRFIAGLRQEDVSLRFKQFPFRERQKILRTVPFEMEDEIPFSQNDAIFEAKISRFQGKLADVLAMACPKERIGDALSLLKDGGVVPHLLSVDSLALSNIIETWQNPPPEIFPLDPELPQENQGELLIDFGHQTSKVLFYQDNCLLGVRHIDWGGKNVIDQIAQKYGLNHIQATKELETKSFILLDKGTGTKEQVQFSSAIETAVENLVKDLRLKILEMQADFNIKFVKAHTLGGPSRIKGLGAYLTQKLEIPFNRFRYLSLQPGVAFEYNDHIEAISATAVGLAIEGLKRPRNPAVNFLRGEFAKQSESFKVFVERWGYAMKLAAAAFVIFAIYGYIKDDMTADMADQAYHVMKTQAANVGLHGSASSPSHIRRFLAQHERDMKSRDQAQKVLKINSPLDVINAVNNAIPAKKFKLDVKRFFVDNEMAEVQGFIGVPADLGLLKASLQTVAVGGKVEAITPRFQAPRGKRAFGFRFRVHRFSGE